MSSSTMRAVRIGADHTISVAEVARPEPAADEILVAPVAGGICGTDLHIVKGEFPQAVFPVVPIHEFAGTVVAAGRNASRIPEGSLVAVDPNIACGECRWCRVGRPNLCVRLSVIGVTRQGAAAELVAVPARCAYVIPDTLGAPLGAMIEPLACVVNATDRAGDLRGRRVLVMGCGVIGLLIAIVSARLGAGETWVSDPAEAKHALARRVGVANAVPPDALAGERFDIVFEAAGTPAAARQVMELLNPTGTWMQVGVLAPEATVDLHPFEVFDREIRIIGSNSLADKFPAAVELMPDISQQAAQLITRQVSVWDLEAGLDSARDARSVKTQLVF
ncbi:MAG: alcohol dehydrogenase catalytic domain-containing protein [Pseudomonadota bacterium]|nr:alcohol dehydrogenase catalytic domain-containing protein [Pseudomonadota bacterium]